MGNLNMEARQIHYRHDNTMTVDNKLLNLEGRVSTLEDGEPAEVSKVDIAPLFSAETAYSAGDYVYHEGHLYKFTADHAAGTWSDLDTESAVVTTDLAELQSDLTTKQDATDNNLQTTDKTVVGAVNELKSGLTNVQADVKLNTNDLTTPSRTKNVLPMTLSRMKSINTTGTWNGAVYTQNDVDFTVNTDTDGNVVNITVNGTASDVTYFYVANNLQYLGTFDGKYTVNGGVSGGSINKYALQVYSATSGVAINCYDSDDNIITRAGYTDSAITSAVIVVRSGVTVDNLVFTPMIRLTTITDSTFAPYVPSVESRLEAVESGNYKVIASVTADGVKTYSELLSGFFTSLTGGIDRRYKLIFSQGAYAINQKGNNHSSFGRVLNFDGAITISAIDIKSNNTAIWTSISFASDGTPTVTDNSANVPPEGTVIKLVV